MVIRRNASFLAFTLAYGLARVQAAQAANVAYGVDAGVGESDNVTLVSNNKVSQTLAVVDADFTVKELSRLLDVAATGNFSYLDFLQGAYGKELIGRFDGTARIALVPEKLTWVFQDEFGQAQIDPFAPVTPDNRENINYFTTGPDVALRLGSVGFVDVTARYARTQYETSPFDNNRFLGTIAVGTPLSARSNLSLDVGTERVLFTNTLLNTDFERSSVYGHYDLQGFRTEITANLGVTRADEGPESLNGPLVKLLLSRQLSASGKLTATAGRDITDGSTNFNGLQSGPTQTLGAVPPTLTSTNIGTAPAVLASANYTLTYASLGWQYVRDRTTVNISGRWEKDSYADDAQFDVTRDTAEFRVDRVLTPSVSAQLIGSLNRLGYAEANFTYTDTLLGFGVSYRAGRALEIRLHYGHDSRVLSGGGSGYAENRVFLTVGYRPRTAAPTQ